METKPFTHGILLSIVERGKYRNLAQSHPTLKISNPRATFIDGCWYGFAFEDEWGHILHLLRTENPKKEVQLLTPKLKWNDIQNKKIIVGLPWCDAWKPRIYRRQE